jgi:hypothetical protein
MHTEGLNLIIQNHKKIDALNNLPYRVVSTYFDIVVIFISMLVVFVGGNEIEVLPLIGFLIIGISIYMCIKVRDNKKLLILFAIVGFINISIGVSDCINKGLYVSEWQLPLRFTTYSVYTAKSILLFLGMINLFISRTWVKRNTLLDNSGKIERKNNNIIATIGTIALYIILALSYITNKNRSGGYVTNSNPIFEYAMIVYIVTWYYSNKNKRIHFMLNIYAVCYALYSFYLGDRSAAFLMIILYYILNYENKISIFKSSILAISGIVISNFIGVIRNMPVFTLEDIFIKVLQRGLYSDTVSYSYYASISISALRYYESNTLFFFLKYLKSLFLGSNEFNRLAIYASKNYKSLFNYSGGIYPSYFYFWFGYLGVMIGASILAIIIRKVFTSKNEYMSIYQVLIPVFSIRWYLYGPTSLFRGIIVLTTFFLFLCTVFDKVSKKTQ